MTEAMESPIESPGELDTLNPTLSAAWIAVGAYDTDHGTTGELIRHQNRLARVAQLDDGSFSIVPHTAETLAVLIDADVTTAKAMIDSADSVDAPIVGQLVTKPLIDLDRNLITERGLIEQVNVWYEPEDLTNLSGVVEVVAMIEQDGEVTLEQLEMTFE